MVAQRAGAKRGGQQVELWHGAQSSLQDLATRRGPRHPVGISIYAAERLQHAQKPRHHLMGPRGIHPGKPQAHRVVALDSHGDGIDRRHLPDRTRPRGILTANIRHVRIGQKPTGRRHSVTGT